MSLLEKVTGKQSDCPVNSSSAVGIGTICTLALSTVNAPMQAFTREQAPKSLSGFPGISNMLLQSSYAQDRYALYWTILPQLLYPEPMALTFFFPVNTSLYGVPR